MSLLALPLECLEKILVFLSTRDVVAVGCSCRALQRIVRGEAECFIMQRDPHTECHKSRKALLAHFKWFRVACAGGRLTVLVFHFSNCVIRSLVPLGHLQADWLTPFDFAAHSYSGREMKRTAPPITCDENTPPSDPPTKKRLSLSLKKPNRFGACVTEEQQSIAAKGVVPANAKVANDWALRNLWQWMDHCRHCGEEQVPDDLLLCKDADLVCRWMCIFVQETRKENGEEYPPSTIWALLAAFQRQMTTNKVGFSLLDKADHRFHDVHNTLDTLCVLLRKKGIGATKKHAAVICPDDEIQCGRVEFWGWTTHGV